MADCLTVMGRFPEAVQEYLNSSCEMLFLNGNASSETPDSRAARVEEKLKDALKGRRNDQDIVR